ncbi:MAG: glycosyltransferase family 39 protein [Candidatus Eremiobacteraeota bacterium]|nr:glycosyltransferase family 39 protein [Candidatus Eremiobacteraeota bacterium]
MKNFENNKIDYLLLFGLFLLVLFLEGWWLNLSPGYFNPDPNRFMNQTRDFTHFLFSEFNLKSALFVGGEYPPLLHFAGSIFRLIFGSSFIVLGLAATSFSLILIFSLYGIGRYLGGRISGWAGALLGVSSPLWFFECRGYNPDVPLAAMTALSLYLLLASDKFKDRKMTLFFFVAFSLGTLSKPSFLFFTIFPLFYLAYQVISKESGSAWLRVVPWLVFAIFIGVGVWLLKKPSVYLPLRANYYYYLVFLFTLGLFLFIILRAVERKKDISKKDSLFNMTYGGIIFILLAGIWYPPMIPDLARKTVFQMGSTIQFLPYLKIAGDVFKGGIILLPVGIISALISKRREVYTLLLLSFLPGWLLVSRASAGVVIPRYALGILPSAVILAIGWLPLIKPKFQKGIFILVLLIVTWQFLSGFWQFQPGHIPAWKPTFSSADRDPFAAEKKLVRIIYQDLPEKDKTPVINVLPLPLSLVTVRLTRFPLDLQVTRYLALDKGYFKLRWLGPDKPGFLKIEQVCYFDYFIVASVDGDHGVFETQENWLEKCLGLKPLLIEEFSLPGADSVIRLYRNPVRVDLPAGEHLPMEYPLDL